MSSQEITIQESGTPSECMAAASSRLTVALAALLMASQTVEPVEVPDPNGGEPTIEARPTADAVAAEAKLARFYSMGSALSSLLSSIPRDQHVHVSLAGHVYDSPLDHDGVNPVRGELTVSVKL